MRLPIRNHGDTPLTLMILPAGSEYPVPVGGEAIVTLEDGRPHAIDVHLGNAVTISDEGLVLPAEVEVYPDQVKGRH
jgi:hypothetical protein